MCLNRHVIGVPAGLEKSRIQQEGVSEFCVRLLEKRFCFKLLDS